MPQETLGSITWNYEVIGGNASIGSGYEGYGTTEGLTLGTSGVNAIIEIPSVLGNMPVVRIGRRAFQQTQITEVTIPASVTDIFSNAFNNCEFLDTVSFAANSQLDDIGDSAFRESAITSIEIPEKVTKIGVQSFFHCGSLTSVTFETGSLLEELGIQVFRGTPIVTISIPALVTSIGIYAFYLCTSLATVFMWPATAAAVSVNFGTGSFFNSPTTTTWTDVTPPPPSPTCFPAGTPIATDQGVIDIEKLTPAHSIRGVPVVAVTRSTGHRTVISLPRSSLYVNVPSQDTYCSLEHKVFHNGRMTKARDLVTKCAHVTKVVHDGAPLYNVLLPVHSRMVVNNLVAETLHPQNAAARVRPPASARR
jgi:hypothetical protein